MPRKLHFVLAPSEGGALRNSAAAAAHEADQESTPDGGDACRKLCGNDRNPKGGDGSGRRAHACE